MSNASLVETLYRSPLYIAPEILQHYQYDAKADLWSVGAVVFKMLAIYPSFNENNYIDLLRNIQRKAIKLPKEVSIGT